MIHAVDSSRAMLAQCKSKLRQGEREFKGVVVFHEMEIHRFLETFSGTAKLALMLEVSELMPNLGEVLRLVSGSLESDGYLILTKVNNRMSMLFPYRPQRTEQLTALLRSFGFVQIEISKYNRRYELVTASKSPPKNDLND